MTPDQMRDASLLELFRLEAEAQTQVLNAGLMALERSPTQADQLEACMRAAHSLKGAARIVGLDAGVRVAHVMEDCLVEAQDGRLLLQSEHIDALLQGCDLLLRIGTPPAGDAGWAEGAGREEIDGLVLRLEGLVRSGLPLARAELPATTPGLPEAVPEAPPAASAAASDDNDEEPAGQAGGEQAEERRSRVLRVTAERLDRLLDISSKSLVEFQRIKPLADSLQRLRRLQSSASRALDVVRETVQETALDPQAQAMLGEARQLIGECQQMLVQHIADLDEFAWQGGQRAQVLYDAALASRMRPFADVLSGQARWFATWAARWASRCACWSRAKAPRSTGMSWKNSKRRSPTCCAMPSITVSRRRKPASPPASRPRAGSPSAPATTPACWSWN